MLREVRPSVPNEIKPADASLRTRRHILDKVKEARPHEQQQARGSDQAGQSQLDRFSAPECTEQQEWHKEAYPCRTGKGEQESQCQIQPAVQPQTSPEQRRLTPGCPLTDREGKSQKATVRVWV